MTSHFSSVSPLDGSVIWRGAATSRDQISTIMHSASEAARSWSERPLEERVAIVRRYGSYLQEHRDQITDLIVSEVGKLGWDAQAEVGAAIAKIELSVAAIQQRRDAHEIGQYDGQVRRVVRFQPLGVVLVLGPFNFPLHLPGGQIIPALLAGNAVVFKPSEQAAAVGLWMEHAWQQAGLPEGVFQRISGGAETAAAAIDSPLVNGVFLTGSRAAGRAIGRQLGGRPDVLLALELGGNNPIVVTDTAAEQAASVISHSAFVSAGQRCTCARRAIFVESTATSGQIDRLVERTKLLRLGLPFDEPPPHVGPLISVAAAESLRETYEHLRQLGARALISWSQQEGCANLVHPAILDASSLSTEQWDEVGEMEWFGPLLVIRRVADFQTAVDAASRTPYGLSASLLGGDQEMFDFFVRRVGAGVVNWNRPTTGAAGKLPFGGLGESGNHRPAGYYAIDFCNDPVASLEAASLPQDDPWDVAN